MLLIIPGALLFYNYSLKASDEIVRAKIELIGKETLESVEKVYYIGESSWETLQLDFPSNVRWVYILDNNEIVVEYDSYVGKSEAVFFSDINITTNYFIGGKSYLSDVPSDPQNMHSGVNIIKITSMGSYVMLNETKG